MTCGEKVIEYLHSVIPGKISIAFLPYKVEMWDSLESVYNAALNDRKCEVKVIPIPYFEKDIDGNFTVMRYDYDKYTVPCCDWQEDIAADVIFIHNPYDSFNKLTSVHPKFYTSNLRKICKFIVYIPYFVLDNDAKNIFKPDLFCLPGVFFSDLVVVQSETMRQNYIDTLNKFCGPAIEKFNIESKIKALGSPKIDKILADSDTEVPENWLPFIEGKKEIILVNETITNITNTRQAGIDKLYRFFEQSQADKDTCIIFRPHPLLEISIADLSPEILEPYKTLVKTFKERKWGIYDDTDDMYISMRLADKLISPHSSVLYLWKFTGKPYIIV